MSVQVLSSNKRERREGKKERRNWQEIPCALAETAEIREQGGKEKRRDR